MDETRSPAGNMLHDGAQESSSKINCFGVFRNWCNKQNEKAAQDEVDKYVLDENRLLVQLACPSFAISGSLMGRNLKKTFHLFKTGIVHSC